MVRSRLLAIGILGTLAAGCASMAPSILTQRRFTPLPPPQPSRIALPPLSTEAIAQVGDTMITGGNSYVRPAIKLTSPVTHSGLSKGPFVLQIPAGILVASGTSDTPVRGTFFEAQQPLQINAGGVVQVKGGIFVPDKQGPSPEIYWHATDTGIPLCDPDGSLQFERTTHEDWQSDSFRRELIYNGRSGATIKLLYREFSQEQIRPAFSQEVTYDLAQGETIGFKGARFQVKDADNVRIKYVVLHHFD
jgi:hypothetical protein